MQKNQYPDITFIIPTLNAQSYLPLCLSAIRSQNYPQSKIEIIISDGGSSDRTLEKARKHNVRIIKNPDVLHEPGKSRAFKAARGELIFFTDADNVLVGQDWIRLMVSVYLDSGVTGLLPQTVASPDGPDVNKYLSLLYTDPFTWFIYAELSNPLEFGKSLKPYRVGSGYVIYRFRTENLPLFGLSQGVGVHRKFDRTGIAANDDIMAGIKLILSHGSVAYVPQAKVYHYHVRGFSDFLDKYNGRVSRNMYHKFAGMGFPERWKYLDNAKKIRTVLFVPYALSLIFPAMDSIKLAFKYRTPVMLWHLPCCTMLALIIVGQTFRSIIGKLIQKL